MSLTLRKATEDDRVCLTEWIEADEAHKGKCEADFFLPTAEIGTQRLAVEGDKGVYFYLRLDNVMQAYIQFPPDRSYDIEEMKVALAQSFQIVATNGHRLGYKKLIFDSVVTPLIRFFKKLKFEEVKDTFGVGL